MEVIRRFRADRRRLVRSELSLAWPAFDTLEYFEAIFEGTVKAGHILAMDTAEKLALLPRLPQLTDLHLHGNHGIPPAVLAHTPLKFLGINDNDLVSDLSALKALPHLRRLSLIRCTSLTDLGPLAGLPLTKLFLYEPGDRLSLAPLSDLPDLRHLIVDFAPMETRLDEWAFAPRLTGVGFFRQSCVTNLDGLEALTSLTWLTVNEEHQWRSLVSAGAFAPLETLQILDVPRVDLADVLPHQTLTRIYLGPCPQVDNIAALTELPALETVELSRCGPIDLTPLARMPRLNVTLYNCDQVTGTDLFPPDRLKIA